MIAVKRVGTHGLVEPFEPKPRVLDPEVLEIYRWIVIRVPPADLSPAFVAEERRRAELLIELHAQALQLETVGAS